MVYPELRGFQEANLSHVDPGGAANCRAAVGAAPDGDFL